MATITRTGTNMVRDDFSNQELYSTSFDAPESHYLSDNTLDALQAIRDWSGQPMRVTSTYRTEAHNTAVGGASNSMHLYGRAIDAQWISNNEFWVEAFRNEMKCRGPLYDILIGLGIRGLGFYNTFLHIDDRDSLAAWDYATEYDTYNMNTAFFQGPAPTECAVFDPMEPNAVNEDQSKKKRTWFQDLIAAFSSSTEDGVAAFRKSLIYLWVVALIGLAAIAIYISRK